MLRSVVLGLFAAFALGFTGWVCLPDSIERLVRRIPDDSFFYFQVAVRFAESHRFTYDGLHETYGFQPLWQLVLCAMAPFFKDRESFLRGGELLLGLLHVATGVLLFRFMAAAVGALGGFAAAGYWLVNPPLLYWSLGGKENALYALLLVAILLHVQTRWLDPDAKRTPASAAALGVLCGLIFLARVNALGFLGMLAATLALAAIRAPRPNLVRNATIAAVAAAAVVAPWLAYSEFRLGGLMPTSGVMKLILSHNYVENQWGIGWLSPAHFLRTARAWPAYVAGIQRDFGAPHLATAAVLAASLTAATLARGRSLARGLREWAVFERVAPLALLFAWAAGSAFVNLLTLPIYVGYASWYAVPEALAGATLFAACFQAFAAAATQWLGPRVRDAAVGALATFAAVAGGYALVTAVRTDRSWVAPIPNVYIYRLARAVAERFPRDVLFGAYDSGILAYFSERDVVSLEGLISERSYAEGGYRDVVGYIRRTGIEYVFGPGREFADGSYQFAWMPKGSYQVEWVPFPGTDFWENWSSTYMLVRPNGVAKPPALRPDFYGFGAIRPPTNSSEPGP